MSIDSFVLSLLFVSSGVHRSDRPPVGETLPEGLQGCQTSAVRVVEGNVHQSVRGEGKKIPDAGQKNHYGSFQETQRCAQNFPNKRGQNLKRKWKNTSIL